jgi:hypothetical protein
LEEWLADLKAFLCSLNCVVKLLPLCPTYTFPQSEHVNLYNLTVNVCLKSVVCALTVFV